MPRRVLQVVPYHADAWGFGGPPRVMWEEARALVSRGHQVIAFTTDACDDHTRLPSGLAVEEGVEIHRFRNVSNWAAYHRYRFTPIGMRAALRTVNADVVHLSETRHELAILAWRAARRRELPFVLSAHGTLPRRGGIKGRVRQVYDKAFVDPMVRGSSALIAQTTHEAEVYVRAGAIADRVELIGLGVDQPPPAGDQPDLGPPPDARVILFLGRVHVLKGVERLLRGFARVAPSHDDVHLVIAGRDDGALESMRVLAAQLGVGARTHFPGAIYGATRYDAYRRADLFAITPVHFEETSLASLEAASVGTPLLLSAQAEAPHLAQYGAGRTIGSADDPADSLDDLLTSDLAAMGRSAERMILERHSWDVIGDELDRLFVKVTR